MRVDYVNEAIIISVYISTPRAKYSGRPLASLGTKSIIEMYKKSPTIKPNNKLKAGSNAINISAINTPNNVDNDRNNFAGILSQIFEWICSNATNPTAE